MEIWSVLIIAIGALAASILAAGLLISVFAPGTAAYLGAIFGGILSLFQTFTQFLRQAIQFLIDHLPRPLKLGMFIVLFAALGGVTYNLTVGAQYVCSESTCAAGVDDCISSNIKDVGWFEGMAFKILPHESLPTFLENRERQNAILENRSNIAPEVIIGVEVGEGASSGDGLITEDADYVWEGNTYHVYYALAAYLEDFVKFGNDFFYTPNSQIWNSWTVDGLDAGSRISYAVCYDKKTETCTLKRNDCGGVIPGLNVGTDMYQREVGYVDFYLSGGRLTGIYQGLSKTFLDNVFLAPLWRNPNDCKDAGVTTEQDMRDFLEDNGISTSHNNFEVYMDILSVKTQADFIATQTFLDQDALDVPLYYVAHAAIFHTLTGTDETFQNLQEIPEDEQNPLDYKINDLLVGGDPVIFSNSDIYRVVCDDETSDPFDTKPLVFGLNILDWKLMALFVLLGAIVSFYMWYRELWN